MASAMKTGMVRLAAKSISSVSNFYGLSQDSNTEPSEWLEDTIPAMTSTWRYLWQYTITYFSNGELETTPPHIIGVFGDKGAKMRMRAWKVGLEMLAGEGDEEFFDIVWLEGDSNNNLYLCKESHTSSEDNNPLVSIAGQLGLWEMAQNWGFIATKVLLAKNGYIDLLEGNDIMAKDSEGNVTAGMSGGDDGIRFWAGATKENRANAPFKIDVNGAGQLAGGRLVWLADNTLQFINYQGEDNEYIKRTTTITEDGLEIQYFNPDSSERYLSASITNRGITVKNAYEGSIIIDHESISFEDASGNVTTGLSGTFTIGGRTLTVQSGIITNIV